MQACYERWDPATPPGLRLPTAAQIPTGSQELEHPDLSGPVLVRRYEREVPYSTAAYLEVLGTYSGHLALPRRGREGLLDCIADLIDRGYGGRVTKRYLTQLLVTQRR